MAPDKLPKLIRNKPHNKEGKEVSSFDYNATRKAYFDKLSEVYKNNFNTLLSGESTEIASVETVKKIIAIVKERQGIDPEGLICGSEKLAALLNSYEVVTRLGEDSLLRSGSSQTNSLLVLGFENAFEVLCFTHTTNHHCDRDKLKELLNKKYEIPKKCYEMFLTFCNVCQYSQSFNKNVQVSIINLPFPEYNFQSVLFYKDLWTDYHLLRPISSNSQEEIAIELLKIFTDFGSPILMDVPTNEKEIFEAVLDNIQKFLPCKVDIDTMNVIDCKENSMKIESMIKNWMEATKIEDWAFGCYAVQMELNNTKSKQDKDCPYVQVFGDLDNPMTEQDLITRPLTTQEKIDIPTIIDLSDD